jgi:type I restriction enzyme S subunit
MSAFPKYERYKDSGVEWLGAVPEHWEVEKGLRYFVETEDRSLKGDEELLSVSHLTGVTPRSEKNITMFMAESYEGSKLCEVGDIAINTMWAWMAALGVSKYRGLVSPSYGTYRQRKPERFNPTFLDHLIRTDVYRSHYLINSTGITTSRLRLYPHSFLRLKFPCPPREEQDRIVAFLDRKTAEIDALITKKQRQIELLDEQKAILIHRAVTRGLNPDAKLKQSSVEWIGDIPKHWEVKRLRYLCFVGTGERDTKNSIFDREYPFFVRSQTAERINSYGFDCEAVLTAGDGAGVGKVFHHIIGKFDAHQRVYVMRNFVEILGRYLFLFLRGNFHRVALTGDAKSTVDSLRRSMLTDFPVPIPPETEQAAIIRHCGEIAEKIANLGATTMKEIRSLETLRVTLIANAVTGRIKV